MKDKAIKNLFSNNKGLSITIIAVAALSILSLLSYMFWDQNLLTWQRQNLEHFNKPLVIKAVVQLGKAWLLVWLLFCWALLTTCRKKALIALIALFLLIFAVFPVKSIIHRPRPSDVSSSSTQPDKELHIFKSWSFPSGDTASIFAVAAAILPFIGWPARTFALALASLVAILRVVQYAHYLSDILAGAAVGIIAAYLAHQLIKSKPVLTKNLLQFLDLKIILAVVIIIPLIIVFSKGLDDLFIFSVFYPPLVIIIYLLSKAKKSYLLSKIS